MPVYILDMLDLSAEIKSAFEKGEFFIRQTSGSFNGNWNEDIRCADQSRSRSARTFDNII
jgi:hypothetical protein